MFAVASESKEDRKILVCSNCGTDLTYEGFQLGQPVLCVPTQNMHLTRGDVIEAKTVWGD
jgi:hypothetical protein